MRHARLTWTGAFHHVMNRGLNKQKIFSDDEMKNKYIELLAEKSEKYNIRIFAYCIMNNHFHIALENTTGNLSGFMKSLNSQYGRYYRKNTNSKGYVFEDRFKSTIIQNESYLTSVILYILLNPLRAGFVKDPFDYLWSSINGYFNPSKIEFIEKSLIEDIFHSKPGFFNLLIRNSKLKIKEKDFGSGAYIGDDYSVLDKNAEKIKCDFYIPIVLDLTEKLNKLVSEFEKEYCMNFSGINLKTRIGRKYRNKLLIYIKNKTRLTYEEIHKLYIFENLKLSSLPIIYSTKK